MKRLTWKRSVDGYTDVGLRKGVTAYEAICKLADYEEAEAEAKADAVEEVHGRRNKPAVYGKTCQMKSGRLCGGTGE